MGIPAATAATPKCFGKKATIVSSKSTIKGTNGNDVIVSRATGGTNYIFGKGGKDFICGGRQFDWISGGPGADKMRGKGNFDFLQGDGGNDTLVGDTNDGGQNDAAMYQFSPGPVNINLATGVTTGHGTDKMSNLESAFGTAFNDTITGSPRTDFLWGLDGDDEIFGGAEFDFIDPGAGNDSADGEEGDFDIIYFQWEADLPVTADLQAGTASGQGDDTFSNFEGIYGSEQSDTLLGDNQDNAFLGGGGNDMLDGRNGFDVATYWLSASAVTANLQTGGSTSDTEGTDTYTSIEGLNGSIDYADHLTGDGNDNILDGDGGDDTLVGAGGNDLFFGNYGSDTVDAGAGDQDFWDYYGSESLTASLVTGVIDGSSFTVTSTGLEWLGGADAADVLTGNDQANVILGWGGNDQIFGLGGNDQVDGGLGTDTGDAGDGQDDCQETETVASCEGQGAIRTHPLQAEADAIDAFRRHL